MKNKFSNKNIGTVISVLAALAVSVLFWLIVKYIDSGAMSGAAVTAFISDTYFGGLL